MAMFDFLNSLIGGNDNSITSVNKQVDPQAKMMGDYQQAQQDLQNAPNPNKTDDSKYVSKATGYSYQKPQEASHLHDILGSVMGYLAGYAQTGDTGAGLANAYQLVKQRKDKEARFGNIDYLEKQGYNPKDIDSYVQSGDPRDLVLNKSTYQNLGEGYVMDNQGNVKRVFTPATETKPTPEKVPVQLDNGQTLMVSPENALQYHTHRQDQALKVDMNDMNFDEGESGGHEPFQDSTGVWHGYKYDSKSHNYVDYVMGPQQQKQLNEKAAASNPSARETLVSQDLNTLSNATPKELDVAGVGTLDQYIPALGNIQSGMKGGKSREVYNAAQRIDSYMLTQGVGEAKAMGASGINTPQEAQMYFASMPRLDKSSPEAFQQSVAKIKAYTDSFNQKNATVQGASRPAPATAPAAPAASNVVNFADLK